MEKNNDRISALPEFIIHQILSYFSNKEAAQKTALSKTWLQAWSTTPFLILNEKDYRALNRYYNFFNFVNETLLRYRTQNLRIHKFHILVLRADQATVCRLLDQSIETALDHGVKDLHISVLFPDKVSVSPYTLPPTIFTSANALTDLRVLGCKFPQNFASTSNAINFPFLKTLVLQFAYIDDWMLEKLFSSCPSIEKVFFFGVLGFKRFLVSNLGELKFLHIRSFNEGGIEVDIQAAPSLRLLRCFGSYKMPGSSANLRRLELIRVNITHNFLKELIIKFPLLEHLAIIRCDGLERVNISSHSLKYLALVLCEKLVEAKIDAPNLLTLNYCEYNGYGEYKGRDVLSLSLHNTPEELMTHIDITHSGLSRPNNTWFHHLGELLKSVSRANVSLSIPDQGVQFDTYVDYRANPLPLENVMPEIDKSSCVFAAFLETLFSSSRPTTISTGRLDPNFVDFIKFLGNELIMATRNSYCCSSHLGTKCWRHYLKATRNSYCCRSDLETKCWRHYLKDIKVDVYENSQNGWQPLPWETLLLKSMCLRENIRFSLKWNANLNAQD